MPTSNLLRAFAALTVFVFVGCSPDCVPESSCYPAGTYIEANEQLAATTAEMDSSGCACGVLFYGWKNGHLDRIN